MKKSINILITGAGSTTAISVIKGLREQKEYITNIIGTDIYEKNNIAGSKFCDEFYVVPSAKDETEYISKLLSIIKNEYIDILIPIVDVELEIVAKNMDKFEDTFVLLSSYETIRTCNDKFKTYQFFKKFQIPTLNTISLDDHTNIKEELLKKGIKYPFIAKPREGVSSRGVYEIKNSDELGLIRRIKYPIVQELGVGEEYTIDIFGDGKKMINAIPRKRIETRSGISYKGKTVNNKELIEYATKIYDNLKFVGPANFQCFLDDKKVQFFDINPRFSGSLPLTIKSGVNMTLFAIQLAKGINLKPFTEFKEVKMCRYWEEVFYE